MIRGRASPPLPVPGDRTAPPWVPVSHQPTEQPPSGPRGAQSLAPPISRNASGGCHSGSRASVTRIPQRARTVPTVPARGKYSARNSATIRRRPITVGGGGLGLVDAERVEPPSEAQTVEVPAQSRRFEVHVLDGQRPAHRLTGGDAVVPGQRRRDAEVVGMPEAVMHRRLDLVGVALGELVEQRTDAARTGRDAA